MTTAHDPDSLLAQTLARITPLDDAAMRAAQERQGQLTKPPGSLGVLEDVSVRLAGIAGVCPPPPPSPAVVGVFAGDHGVHAEGVTPWPQAVTVAMVDNIVRGGAAINAIARQVGADVWVVDVGVAGELPSLPGLRRRRVRAGTANMAVEPAMTLAEAHEAIEAGIAVAQEALDSGARCLLTGDMGIANTTASVALICAFTGGSPHDLVGLGAGADDASRGRKRSVIERALALHHPDPTDALATLAALGGLEHGALAGFILGAVAARVPVILDGVIACAAALIADQLHAAVSGYLFSGHAGVEPGITPAVNLLGLRPLLDLDLRLGEGTGAALALPIVQAGARVLAEMATFAEAGIDAGDG